MIAAIISDYLKPVQIRDQSVEEKFAKIVINREMRIKEFQGTILKDIVQGPLRKGMHFSKILKQLGISDSDAILQSVIRSGKTILQELSFDEKSRWVVISVEPVAKESKITGAAISMSEITVQKRKQGDAELNRKMSHLSLLAEHIVHRLNNPLATILNQIGCLLLEDMKNEDWPRIRQELLSIQEQIYALSLVTNGLDVFAKDGGATGKLVRVNAVLERAIELVQLLHGQKQVHYHVELDIDIPPVFGNEIALEQAILHILRNSLDAMPKQGKLDIKSRIKSVDQDFIEIVIRDNGVGIPAENLQQVFEPFCKWKSGDHLGLGLSISFAIIMNLNGYIELTSKPGRGTTVTVSLPIAKSYIKQG